MVQQSVKNWQWLIAVDPETPECNLFRLHEVVRDARAHLIPWLPQSGERASWPLIVRGFLDVPPPHLITTRLDNDDAFHERALETIQMNVDPRRAPHFIDLPIGLFMHAESRTVRLTDRSSWFPDGATQFVSLVERPTPTPPRTVYCQQHHLVGKVAPVVKVTTAAPMSMTLVHGMNWLNKMPAGGMPLAGIPAGFPAA
jgi:hypothetical protein